MTLLALLFPAIAFPAGLWLVRGQQRFAWVADPARWPLEAIVLAAAGGVATLAGLLDWLYHRSGKRVVSARERRCELLAMGLAAPMFGLLCLASLSERAGPLLVPVLALALVIAALIAHDETRYHRACTRYETLLHRLLVAGNGTAFLCWIHWCFARDAGHVAAG